MVSWWSYPLRSRCPAVVLQNNTFPKMCPFLPIPDSVPDRILPPPVSFLRPGPLPPTPCPPRSPHHVPYHFPPPLFLYPHPPHLPLSSLYLCLTPPDPKLFFLFPFLPQQKCPPLPLAYAASEPS